eukprot:COSAG06_NODE_27129_length_600_cov_0.948104_1_plen_36_part_10
MVPLVALQLSTLYRDDDRTTVATTVTKQKAHEYDAF